MAARTLESFAIAPLRDDCGWTTVIGSNSYTIDWTCSIDSSEPYGRLDLLNDRNQSSLILQARGLGSPHDGYLSCMMSEAPKLEMIGFRCS